MTSSPAFQFYPHDFLAGRVATYAMEVRGVYITLLSFDWTLNGLPTDELSLARLCGISSRKFAAIWPILADQFPVEERESGGRRFNPRLQMERKKQAAWREKSSKGGKARHGKGGSATLQPPLQPNASTPSPSPTPVTDNYTHTHRTRATVDRFAAADQPAVTAFLAGLPSSQSADVWAAAIGGWLDGLAMPRNRPAPPEIIAVALRDWVMGGEHDYSPAYVRAFVLRVAREWKRERDAEAGRGGAGEDARSVAWLDLAHRHDLLTYSGSGTDYRAKVDRARCDPAAPATFDADMALLRLHDGIGHLPRHLALREIATRLTTPARRAAA